MLKTSLSISKSRCIHMYDDIIYIYNSSVSIKQFMNIISSVTSMVLKQRNTFIASSLLKKSFKQIDNSLLIYWMSKYTTCLDLLVSILEARERDLNNERRLKLSFELLIYHQSYYYLVLFIAIIVIT